MAETFRVLAYDLNTNTLLTEIPANSLAFSRRLGDAGSISFSVALQSPTVRAIMSSVLAYDGVPVAVYVDRNGVLVWGGVVWTTLYDKASGTLSYGGKEFLSYFDQRVLAKDYSTGTVDPAALLAAVIVDAQNVALAGPGASIGVAMSGGASSLTTITQGYPLAQHSMVTHVVSDMLQILQPGVGGLDLTQAVAYDVNGNPTRTFTVSSPRAGRAAGNTGLIFDLDSCINYTWPTDASQTGNTVIATGAGNGASTPTATVAAPGIPVGLLGQSPKLEKVISFQSLQSQAQVSLAANGAAQQYGQPIRTPTVEVPTNSGQPYGSWIPGDDARLYTVGNERFPNGKSEFWRIVSDDTKVPDEGLSTTVIIFNPPPVY